MALMETMTAGLANKSKDFVKKRATVRVALFLMNPILGVDLY